MSFQHASLDDAAVQGRDGDPLALEHIFGEARRIAESTLPARVAHLDRQDLVQETLMRVWTNLSRFEVHGDAAFRRWVCTIARNALTDHRRRHVSSPLVDEPTDTRSDPLDAVGVRERRRWLGRGLWQVPGVWRRCLVRRYAWGEEVHEVARRMGRSGRSVHGLTRRGSERLAEVLRHSDGGPSRLASSSSFVGAFEGAHT